jgi:uncharacterized protein YoxC
MLHLWFAQLAGVADTLLIRQLPPERTAFEQTVFVASGITSILMFVLLVAVLATLIALKAKADDTRSKMDELLAALKPLANDSREMFDDLRAIAKSSKVMVEESKETVTDVNARVRETVDNLADKVDDLSSMIGRINASAERVASITTTAVGGIKAGARYFGIGKNKKNGKKKGKRSRDEVERPRLRRRD